MKVILLQNVAGVGQKYDVKDVKDGFWRNFLLPRGLAKEATDEIIKQIEIRKKKEEDLKKAGKDKLSQDIAEINNKELVLELKADEKGNLFAGLGAKKIANYIKDRLDLEIPPEIINIEKPIKAIGSHEIPIKDTMLKLEIKKA